MKSNRGLALFTMKSVRASVTWRLVVFLVICFAVNENFSAEETRVWKTADGKFSVEAEFVNIEDDVVRLRRADNNRSASVPVEMLSRSDRKYIQKRIEQGMDSSRLKYRRAAWMEGQWGFRFNMPGMKQPEALAEFDVQKMIDQIKVLDTASWVQINLTQGANGSFYTSPHPELAKHVSPAIELIEKNNEINGSLGHFFPPMQETWNSGKPAFETEQAVDWTMRIVQSKGAITWAVALADAAKKRAPLATFQFKQLKAINKAVKNRREQ